MTTTLTRLTAARAALDAASSVVVAGARHLAATGDLDPAQVVAYDLAHAAAAVETARAFLDYGERGDTEARLVAAFVADAVHGVATSCMWRDWGASPDMLEPAAEFVRVYRAPEFLASLCGEQGPRHLDDQLTLIGDTFRRFADEQIRPAAEDIHRRNLDIPESIIRGLGELGAFGVSIPEQYGGFAASGEDEYLAMVVATEELSRGSLGAGGSLITRPEILARALLAGGSEEHSGPGSRALRAARGWPRSQSRSPISARTSLGYASRPGATATAGESTG